jgi:hypothetical protein
VINVGNDRAQLAAVSTMAKEVDTSKNPCASRSLMIH